MNKKQNNWNSLFLAMALLFLNTFAIGAHSYQTCRTACGDSQPQVAVAPPHTHSNCHSCEGNHSQEETSERLHIDLTSCNGHDAACDLYHDFSYKYRNTSLTRHAFRVTPKSILNDSFIAVTGIKSIKTKLPVTNIALNPVYFPVELKTVKLRL